MMRTRLLVLGLLIGSMPLYNSSASAAAQKSKSELIAQLRDTLTRGEIVQLNAGNSNFLGIYTDDMSGAIQGGAILLHDAGTHLDWPQVVSPLRRTLPDYGWATLSIQTPSLVAPYSAPVLQHSFDTIGPRIDAAVDFFHQQGIRNVVLIGYGAGATLGAFYLGNNPDSNAIKGFVGIAMAARKQPDARLYTPDHLEKINIPVLDIYGSRDAPATTATARARADGAQQAGNKTYREGRQKRLAASATATKGRLATSGFIAYRQIRLAGADHGFTGMQAVLVKRIIGWLRKHASGAAVNQSASNTTQNQ